MNLWNSFDIFCVIIAVLDRALGMARPPRPPATLFHRRIHHAARNSRFGRGGGV